ncbi:PorT family protein [Ferruginibacter lapsinanis]|uniref:outer membrane beta-barrel protein n=1 Tax=Ferruginibacter lapsinanis TaxID=563172 RepID=UPI001E3B8C50|nr:outer membrane beta-barrel protein [Ferruginibacter lapsinanis]UEG50855.1 PorT family protein [Ferruginibacter lapsinanis]
MKKFILVLFVFATATVSAQKKKDWSKVELDKAGDHIMFQLSSDHWGGIPDSISSHIKGLSRGMNLYIMMNKPFKTDPRWSVAFGIGVGSSSILFKKMGVDVKAGGGVLPFINQDSLNHFKKYKLVTAYLEAPVEIRYTFNPENTKKSWKIAVGVKVGTMLNAHTKGKFLQDKYGNTINSYTAKESRKNFFNTTRLCGTARVGVGNFSLFGSYQLNSFLKDGAGPAIKPYQIGLCLSGL